MVRIVQGTKSPQMVRNVYGTKSLWYEKSGIRVQHQHYQLSFSQLLSLKKQTVKKMIIHNTNRQRQKLEKLLFHNIVHQSLYTAVYMHHNIK